MDMSAVIVCGGFATRMKEVCKTTPESLLKIGSRPVRGEWNFCLIKHRFGLFSLKV